MPEVLVFGKVSCIVGNDSLHSGTGNKLDTVDEDHDPGDDTLDVPEPPSVIIHARNKSSYRASFFLKQGNSPTQRSPRVRKTSRKPSRRNPRVAVRIAHLCYKYVCRC